MPCYITNEINRMLSEQEDYDSAYEKAVTEVEMDFLATHEAQEVLFNYVIAPQDKTGLVDCLLNISERLKRNKIGAEDVDVNTLLAIVMFRAPAYKIALNEICSRTLKAAHKHGYIERMAQEKME